jgi:ATP-dependent 26S proteasome regulatory subunit
LAKNYELTGAQIVSVIMYASLLAIEKNEKQLTKEQLLLGIKAELEKEERQFNPI